MKLAKLFNLLIVAVMLLGLTAACTQAGSKKLTIASDATWPPMEFLDDSKNIVGFDIDLITAIAKDRKFEFEIKNTAWDGIFAGLDGGAYDAIMSSVTITDERKQKYDFSDSYFNADQGIVVRSDDTTIKTAADLTGKKVGSQLGTTGEAEVQKVKGVVSKSYDTADLAMMDLLNKNLDAVVVDTPVAADFALNSAQFKGKLKIGGVIVTNEVFGFVAKKGDPKKVLPLFNAGLKNIKASGEYDKIYTKWFGVAPTR